MSERSGRRREDGAAVRGASESRAGSPRNGAARGAIPRGSKATIKMEQ
jgi:hypothetical protein